jgi:hypothetical protein
VAGDGHTVQGAEPQFGGRQMAFLVGCEQFTAGLTARRETRR